MPSPLVRMSPPTSRRSIRPSGLTLTALAWSCTYSPRTRLTLDIDFLEGIVAAEGETPSTEHEGSSRQAHTRWKP
jgi:hypothetical protein